MSDTEEAKPQAAKPSRLSGLIAPKGAAPRPSEQSASTTAPASVPPLPPSPDPVPVLRPVLPPVQATPIGTGSKSLTLRLPDAEYERLRLRAFASRMTHQAILAEALRQYLDTAEAE